MGTGLHFWGLSFHKCVPWGYARGPSIPGLCLGFKNSSSWRSRGGEGWGRAQRNQAGSARGSGARPRCPRGPSSLLLKCGFSGSQSLLLSPGFGFLSVAKLFVILLCELEQVIVGDMGGPGMAQSSHLQLWLHFRNTWVSFKTSTSLPQSLWVSWDA